MERERPDTPFVLLDRDKLEANIAAMAAFSRAAGVALRPHVKAHKTSEIALKQLAAGAVGVTVTTLKEAEVMYGGGVKNIFLACQLADSGKIRRLFSLGEKAEVSVALDSNEGALLLAGAAKERKRRLSVLLEVNTGLDRCGVLPGKETLELAREVMKMPGLRLKGIFTHAGQVYGASSPAEVSAIGRQEGELMVKTAEILRQAGIPVEVVSVGSTPTACVAGMVKGVTEIRPGNYVFYDAIQVGLGVVPAQRCALSVVATVISKPVPGRIVIDAGSKSLALDRGAHGTTVVEGYGIIKKYPHLTLARLSEEHGIIQSAPEGGREPEIGEQLEIIPNHACVVVNLADHLVVARDGEIVERWQVKARGH